MVNGNSPLIRPGVFELYVGCMKSGKTRRLIERLDKLEFVDDSIVRIFKPSTDTRDILIKSRFGDLSFDCTKINPENPYELFEGLDNRTNVIAFDEMNFFG